MIARSLSGPLSGNVSGPLTGDIWTPRKLYLDGTLGAYFDIAPQFVYQDSAGTTAASVGDPVGYLTDRSGNGNHATQSVAASRPILRQDAAGRYYLEFDGVDDFLVTSAIDFTGTDKMFVCAGVRKESDTATGMVLELSATLANDGTINLTAPPSASAQFGLRSRGTLTAVAETASSYPAPLAAVLAGRGDISGDSATLRVDGVQAASAVTDQGTGNYGNYPFYIGMRGGSSLPFNGRLYSLVVAGKQATDAEIQRAESYAARKTGVSL